jgi:allantoicase
VSEATARPDFTDQYIDLAQPRLGARVLYATDDFFAAKERLIDPASPVFVDGKYDDHGKWMDGWESRRKRVPGHDYCIIRICPGEIHGIEIDTAFFTGNYPPQASLEVCHSSADPDESTQWTEILAKSELRGNSKHYFSINDARSWTHVRFHIYPDGGVARLRLYGVATFDWSSVAADELTDLLAMRHGGRALAANDMHYGHMSNLLAPGDGVNMGDGWETRRRREPGNDWVILKLGHSGCLKRILVDTAFFKGNYPARCSLHGAMPKGVSDSEIRADADYWRPILPEVELGPDQKHVFEMEVLDHSPVSHVRLDIYPDGGVSRLRLYGYWR